MSDLELAAPHHVTVGYVGRPGERTFFLQAQDEGLLVSFKLEKVQVQGIADLVAQLLAQLGDGPATDWDRALMALRDPVEARWDAGELALGFDEERGRFLLEVAERGEDEHRAQARLWFDRDQARRLAAEAAAILAEGRPLCQLCGRPLQPGRDHVCPATNGHGRLSR